MKILYCKIGWMKAYKGVADERPLGGGAYNRDHIGFESYNYLGVNGEYYGFVNPNPSIDITRLGAENQDNSIDDVLVVWVALRPGDRQYIVGWYESATVYRRLQAVPECIMESRNLKTHNQYNIYSSKATLLNESDRDYLLAGMGQSNIWYGDDETNSRVYEYIKNKNNETDKGF